MGDLIMDDDEDEDEDDEGEGESANEQAVEEEDEMEIDIDNEEAGEEEEDDEGGAPVGQAEGAIGGGVGAGDQINDEADQFAEDEEQDEATVDSVQQPGIPVEVVPEADDDAQLQPQQQLRPVVSSPLDIEIAPEVNGVQQQQFSPILVTSRPSSPHPMPAVPVQASPHSRMDMDQLRLQFPPTPRDHTVNSINIKLLSDIS